jgi:hypothetical protein
MLYKVLKLIFIFNISHLPVCILYNLAEGLNYSLKECQLPAKIDFFDRITPTFTGPKQGKDM